MTELNRDSISKCQSAEKAASMSASDPDEQVTNATNDTLCMKDMDPENVKEVNKGMDVGAQNAEASNMQVDKESAARKDARKLQNSLSDSNSDTTSKRQKTIDSDSLQFASSILASSREEMARREEENHVIKFEVITNDGLPEHLIQLTTLKNIFARQLPKMPKEYIVRLVFDRKHKSMLLLKNSMHVIGGICYRPFEANHFAEIAFCAINASDQVKGYGTRLMNHLKEHVKTQGIHYFLTYADNYAIGYFKKQGFSKSVSMSKSNWMGYIKDYDGGTLMECRICEQVNYLRIASMICQQRKKILEKLAKQSQAHVVYSGLERFAESRLIDIYTIPGVREAGWSQAMIRNNKLGTREHGSLKAQLTQLWKAISSHRSSWPFHEAVDTKVVVDYLEYIKVPMDLSEIAKRIERGYYVSKAAMKTDLDLMCRNCTIYNTPDTTYYKAAIDLQEYIDRRIQIRDGAPRAK